jgi:hypothetical protein
MDRTISRLAPATVDPVERALLEIDVAITLVLTGGAVSVQLCGLHDVDDAAFTGAAWAQDAGLAFRVRRNAQGSTDLLIGPRLRAGRSRSGLARRR